MKAKGFGKHGWLLIAIGFFTMFCGTIPSTAMNTIAPKIAELTGQNSEYLLSLTAFNGFFIAFMCIFFGYIQNKFHSGKLLFMAGRICMFSALALAGFITKPWQFVIFSIMISIGASASGGYGLSIIINNWFPHKKGIIFGMITVGINVGSMSINWLLSFFWDNIGVKGGFIVLSLISLIPFFLMLFLKEKPEMQGCFPDNEPCDKISSAEDLSVRDRIISKTSPYGFKTIIRNKHFWFATISCSLMVLVNIGIDSSIVNAALSFGDSWSFGMGLITILSIIGMPCSIILGTIDTKLGTRKAGIIVALFGIFSLMVTVFHEHMWSTVLFVISYGCFIGAVNNLFSSMLISVFGRHDFSKVFAFSNPIFALIQNLGTPLTALIPRIFGRYEATLFVFSGLLLIALIMLLLLGDECVGRSDEEVERDIAVYNAANPNA